MGTPPLQRFAYIEMDSMDQAKCSIPHFRQPHKDFNAQAAVPTILTCARIPGIACLEYVYNNNFPHDANTTVTVLHKYACYSHMLHATRT